MSASVPVFVDKNSVEDIKDTPEDRDLYPSDWKVALHQEEFDDLLRRLTPAFNNNFPGYHPNKLFSLAMNYLVTGKSIHNNDLTMGVIRSFDQSLSCFNGVSSI